MTIKEMHVMFREMAQQMGMQTTRAILNEDIDICINSAIIDKVREVLTENVQPAAYPDKVIRQNAVITPINSIRTLYCKAEIGSNHIKTNNINGKANELNPWHITIDSAAAGDKKHKVMLYTGFKVSYDNSSLYDCRLIEAEDLGQTLRDFCNRAAPDAPIAVVFGDKDSIDVDLYTGRTVNTWDVVDSFIKPKVVQFLYIKEPEMVKRNIDDKDNVDCDLPPYLHSELVERAVSKYLISIGATSGQRPQQNND